MILRVVSEVLPRILALVALWSLVANLGTAITSLSTATDLYQAVKALWSLTISLLALASIGTASPTLFVATVLATAISGLSPEPLTRGITIAALLAMMMSDVVKRGYRSSQRGCVRVSTSIWNVLLSLLPLTAIVLAVVLGSGFVTRLVIEASSLVKRAFASSGMTYIATALANPFIEIALIGVLTYVLYRFVSQGFEIAALFAYPPSRLSMQMLLSRSDIDRRISVPLASIRSVILGSIFAPPVYAAVYYVAVPAIERVAPWITRVASNPLTQFLTALALLILLSLAMRSISFERLWQRPLTLLKVSVAIALTIYGCSVYLAIVHGMPIARAFVEPDLAGFGRIVASTYLGYYSQFIYVVNTVLRLMGAAP